MLDVALMGRVGIHEKLARAVLDAWVYQLGVTNVPDISRCVSLLQDLSRIRKVRCVDSGLCGGKSLSYLKDCLCYCF